MKPLVQKYGGTSLSTAEHVRRVAERIDAARQTGRPTVAVVSARGDTTDRLLADAKQLHPHPAPRETDQLLATGEVASAALMATALHRRGTRAVSLTGAQAGIRTTGPHGAALIDTIDTRAVRAHLERGSVVVVAGFQGIDPAGELFTLGRGGSDTTAVALAAALDAQCEIYTDVDAVYTADPRLVPRARPLPEIAAPLMAEMAFAGARVLHARAVELAAVRNVPLLVASAMQDRPGTTITGGSPIGMLEKEGFVAAITHDADIARFTIRLAPDDPERPHRALRAIADQIIPVDLVTWADDRPALSFTVAGTAVHQARRQVELAVPNAGRDVAVQRELGKISLLGTGMLTRPEYAVRVLRTLEELGISANSLHTNQLRVSVLVPAEHTAAAVAALHDEFELDRPRPDPVPTS
ncbi:aspartate kinase [Saccharopolyspora shandongensis]|uniref:aspartate kinase n=1 Tax=Saccharopolyspora shandongensis TaxID=418495 RepID=UPI003401EB23